MKSAASAAPVVGAPGGSLLPSWVRSTFWLVGVLTTAFVVSVVVHPGVQNSVAVNGWGSTAIEVVAALLCLAAAWYRPRVRALALVLGAALLSWSIGDIVLIVQSSGGATPPDPSLADAFYLAFYPLAYVGLLLLVRRELVRLRSANWLDGAVAGCGAAALCAAFAFPDIIDITGGSHLATVVNLAYPVGDILLLALVVGGTALLPGRKDRVWILVGLACLVNAIGDTANLFQTSPGSLDVASAFDAIAWPMAIVLMALAVWQRPRRVDLAAPLRPTGFLLPGLAATACLAILVTATQEHMTGAAIWLATVTMVLVGVRLSLSIRSLRKVTAERHRQSITDELTGLGNRRRLFDILDAYFDRQSGDALEPETAAFIFLDLDRFKEVNDSFGHSAGDELLRQLGPRLLRVLRETDVLVRLGGDEFAIVLIGGDAAYATSVAERVAAELEERFTLQMVSAQISGSMGIALAPADATSSAELLRCADVAMYRAKRNHLTYAVYDSDVDEAGNLLQLAEELRHAAAAGTFELHFQPQLDLRLGTISAFEALIRWPHPRLGELPPQKFLPLAEEAGLMALITAWVLDQALVECARWQAVGHDQMVAVNISASNLLDEGFLGLVADALERHGLPASVLTIEITETCIISDYERARSVIDDLAASGVDMSVDDFGAGFTSLPHLTDLSVAELKLDQEFITGLSMRRRERDLVRSTINLGHALGLRVVAEGVEDLDTLHQLAALGCDLVQGYVIARPVPIDVLGFEVPITLDDGSDRRQLILHRG